MWSSWRLQEKTLAALRNAFAVSFGSFEIPPTVNVANTPTTSRAVTNDAARYTEIDWNPLNIVSHAPRPSHEVRVASAPRMIALSCTMNSALKSASGSTSRLYGSAILMS